MYESSREGQNFIGFEYMDVTVSRGMASLYADSYANFGYTLEGTAVPVGKYGAVTLKLKRDRKIKNKPELTRLQHRFDACVSEIETLERSKVIGASAAAYIIGVAGTALMAGSVFAWLGSMPVLSIILAVPAFAGWIVPYFCFVRLQSKKTAQVAPLIEKKYDEIYEVCERADSLRA
jgi:hypothetical protein